MTSLVEFLTARLNDDEKVATAAFISHESDTASWFVRDTEVFAENPVHPTPVAKSWPGEVAHIARHDPARVLREVKAKRRILDDYEITLSALPHSDDPRGTTHAAADAFWAACSALADVYSDHPDYREKWA